VKKRKKFKRNLEVLAFNGLVWFARCLPRKTGLVVFAVLGSAASHLFRKDRQRALDNLELAFPDTPEPVRSALAAAMFKTLGRNFFEFLNLEGSSKERLGELVEKVLGEEHLDRAMAAHRGLIAITGHIGCWELLAAYFASRGYPLNVVGRELWEKRLNKRLLTIRDSMGYRTIDRDSSGKEMIRALRDKQVVAVLIDQHTRVSGIHVPFFDRPAHTPVGVAKLAVATGAPILPMAIYMRRNGRHEIRILPPVELPGNAAGKEEQIEELTRRCSRAVEELVRYDPKQWVWFHNRWQRSGEERRGDEAVH
jgi:KDO2-lipid IV(A) lauroyltransferase